MKKNNFWFTLIEILVWTTISIILMIWVWVFVTSWMKNITIQKWILNAKDEYVWFFNELNDIFSNNFDIIKSSSGGIVVKTRYNLWKPQIYDFSVKTFTWECQNDETIETKYLELNNYNPFFLNSWSYSWSYLKNQIYSGPSLIIWAWISWDNLVDWMSSISAYLNNPAWITSDWTTIFISDSANNRILYSTSWKLYNLLDYTYWIYSPTWILYDDNELFILNSWNNELLSLSSKISTPKPLDLSFKSDESFSFNRLKIEVLDNFTIWWSYNTWSFNFSWISKNTQDSVSLSSNELTYSFTWSRNISDWDNYKIKISGFGWTFNEKWSYYVKLSFLNWDNSEYEKFFPYQVSSDGNVLTNLDNDFKVLTWYTNNYFTDIALNWTNLLLKDYISWEYLELTKDGEFVWSWTITIPNNFETFNKKYGFKIKDFNINLNWNLLTIKLEYYKNFSCIDETQNIIKTLLFKKTLSN